MHRSMAPCVFPVPWKEKAVRDPLNGVARVTPIARSVSLALASALLAACAGAPAAIIGYSGLLVGPENLSEAKARDAKGQTPPILLIHGDQDPLIPLDAMFIAANDLAAADFPNQWHLSRGVGHGIDAGGLKHGGLFLAKNFGLRAAR